MKNSGWYHKLWRKKLDELPVKGSADAGWASMQQQLNAHLPVPEATTGGGMAKPLISKIIALTGYVLPAAAMVGIGSYFAVTTGIKHKPENKKSKKVEYRVNKTLDSISKIGVIKNNNDTLTLVNAATHITAVQSTGRILDSINNAYNLPKAGQIKATNAILVKGFKGESFNDNTYLNKSNTIISDAANNRNWFGNTKNTKRAWRNARSSYQIKGDKASLVPNSISRIKGKNFQSEELMIYGSPILQTGARQSMGQNTTDKYETPNPQHIKDEVRAPAKPTPDPVAAVKVKVLKAPKNRNVFDWTTPNYNYGIQVGLNTGTGGSGLYMGVTGNYALNKRWVAEGAVVYNSAQTLTGNFSHPSYNRPDSSAVLPLVDTRKVHPVDVLLHVQYRVNGLISLKAGPVLSFAGKQTNVSTRLGATGSFRDTLGRTGTIDSVRNTTVLANKISVGVSTGVGITFKHLSIDARYLWLPPYKVSNSWGNYNQTANRLQIGVSYLFKSK